MQNFHILCIYPRLDPARGVTKSNWWGVYVKVGGVNPPEGCRKIPGYM